MHAYNLSPGEVEARGAGIHGHLWLTTEFEATLPKTLSQKQNRKSATLPNFPISPLL